MRFELISEPDECVLTHLIKITYNIFPKIGGRSFDKNNNKTMISLCFSEHDEKYKIY